MTAFTAPYADFMRVGESSMRTAVSTWTQLFRQAFASVPYVVTPIDLDDAVDTAFELSRQALRMQRELAKTLLAASANATEIAKVSLSEAAYYVKRAA